MRSRGVELDITGNPTENLSIIGGFSYNNSVYLDTPEKGYVENQRLVRTPATTANASVFYKFTNYVKVKSRSRSLLHRRQNCRME
jgi:iron complex outermembrane receptor protein